MPSNVMNNYQESDEEKVYKLPRIKSFNTVRWERHSYVKQLPRRMSFNTVGWVKEYLNCQEQGLSTQLGKTTAKTNVFQHSWMEKGYLNCQERGLSTQLG